MRLSHIIMFSFAATGFACLLTSCGGGGGGGDAATTSGVPTSSVLGERSVPGYVLRVTRMATVADGTITVRISIVPDANQPLPTAVTCWIASDYDPAANTVSGVPVPGTLHEFDVTLPIPLPRPAEAAVWVRLTLPDGTVQEVGRGSFPV